MAEEAARSRLGRGLAALIGDVGAEASVERPRGQRKMPIEFLRPNPRNPRRAFTEAELNELSESIRGRGIIQPIVVREHGGAGYYEIVAGERRWRAAQRADLNPIEEAAGYVALMEQCNHTQEQVAQIVGKSRPHVANMVRLLKLPEPVKALVRAGKLSAGHARLLVGHVNAQILAEMAIDEGYSVRQLEEWVREDEGRAGDATFDAQQKKIRAGIEAASNADTRALERQVSDILGLEVKVDHRGEGGTLHIKYKTLDQLDAVLRKLGGG